MSITWVCAICIRSSFDRYLCGSFSGHLDVKANIGAVHSPTLGEITDLQRPNNLLCDEKKVFFQKYQILTVHMFCVPLKRGDRKVMVARKIFW